MEKIVLLTGAGISAESGVPTFRGAGGLWKNHRAEDLATPEAFDADPALVQAFYNMRRQKLINAVEPIKPNAAHHALVKLQREFSGESVLITQNVDHLHEAAGFEGAIHMHGEILKSRCNFCGNESECISDLSTELLCSVCNKAGGLRPAVVWFGEMPLHMDVIEAHLRTCDLFVSIGTSGHVYPAAGFVGAALEAGAHTLEINLESSSRASLFHEFRHGPAGELVPQWVDQVLGGRVAT